MYWSPVTDNSADHGAIYEAWASQWYGPLGLSTSANPLQVAELSTRNLELPRRLTGEVVGGITTPLATRPPTAR